VLHRYRLLPPAEGTLFTNEHHAWWHTLPVSTSEQVRIAADLATLDFATAQVRTLEAQITAAAGGDARLPLLI
jgi:hypothetical protein